MPPRKAQTGSTKSTTSRDNSSVKDSQSIFMAALQGLTGRNDGRIIPLVPSTASRTQESASANGHLNGDIESLESDDDAPEAVSLNTGRNAAEEEETRVKEFEASTAAKRKHANRERDRSLKERAEMQGGGRRKRKAAEIHEAGAAPDPPSPRTIPLPPSDDTTGAILDAEQTAWEGFAEGSNGEFGSGENEAEVRMRRAMREAEEQDDEDEEDEGAGQDDPSSEHEDLRERTTTSLGPDMEVDADPSQPSGRPPRQLPDHVFASAAKTFAQARKEQNKQKRKTLKSKQASKSKDKKRQTKPSVKERAVGSTTVRVLPSKASPDSGGRSAIAAARFMRQKLSLTQAAAHSPKQKKNPKGWDRKEAHLTVNQGLATPARGFARSARQ